MVAEGEDASGVAAVPVVLISYDDSASFLSEQRRVTFPLVSQYVTPMRRVSYSSFSPVASGRLKPEIVLPGDNIASTAAGAALRRAAASARGWWHSFGNI